MTATKRNKTVQTRTEILYKAARKRNRMKEEIDALMKAKGWKTQADLARAMGVSESTAYRWCEGLAMPIPPLRSKLRELLAEAIEERDVAKQTA
jgi:transcriptional regulator with XRE-family HTH domain